LVFGVLGDIHGDFETTRRIMERHRDVPFWLCVGDVATADGKYEALPVPLHWIKGNNENFDAIAANAFPHNLHYIPNAHAVTIGSPEGLDYERAIVVAGLGGTLAPTMYELTAAELPHPRKSSAKATEQADRRRHFVREEVDACKSMKGVDIFMSHEAPRPFRVHRGIDAGKTPINDILQTMKPRLHLFGHHHKFVEGTAQGVPSLCLDLVSRSYLLVDAKTLVYRHLPS